MKRTVVLGWLELEGVRWNGWRSLAAASGLAIGYFAAALIGLNFAIPPGNATAIWPPSGIALAALLLLGPQVAPGIWLGATLANVTTGVSLPVAIAIGCGNTLEALAGAWLLRRRKLGPSTLFRSASGAFTFAAVAVASSAIAASVGVAGLRLGGQLPWSSLASNWVTWWLGDAAGIVILAPLLLSGREVRHAAPTQNRWAEAALAAAALVTASLFLFAGLLNDRDARALLYLPLLLLVWLAMRFPLQILTGSTVLMTIIAAWGTSHGIGVFGGDGAPQDLLHVQLLMISYALTGLAVFATVSRRRDAEAAVQRSRDSLARTVSEKTRDLATANVALRREAAQRNRLEEAERLRLATALESAGEGIMITDPTGTITYVNPAFELITGYGRREVVGSNPRVLRSGKHDSAFYQRLWRTISKGAIWRGSFVDRKKDSSFYDVDSTIAPIREADGSLIGYVAVSRDVTEQKQAERALRDSECRLRAILDTAADGIVIFDEDGFVESANPAAAAIFGRSTEELVGCPASTLLPPHLGEDLPFPESLLRSVEGSALGSLREKIGMRSDGRVVPLDAAFTEVRLGDRRLLAGFMHDTTERRARLDAEKELLKATEELRLARTIQESFYPAEAPRLPGLDIAGLSLPAQHAGGDYFDYLTTPGDGLEVVIADVSGHGLAAALRMSQTRAYLRSLVDRTEQVAELLTRLNLFLVGDCAEEHFVTMFLVRLDSTRRSFEYASAGHQGYLIRSSGEVEVLPATGIPLGVMADRTHGSRSGRLDSGDLLLLLTDGIEEAQSSGGDELGREQALEIARIHRHRPAAEIVAALVEGARDFADGRPQDDVTAVVVKACG